MVIMNYNKNYILHHFTQRIDYTELTQKAVFEAKFGEESFLG